MSVTAAENLENLALARRWAKNGTARLIRERAGVSQAEIAVACGVARSAVSLWEAGKRAPQGDPAINYAQALAGLAQHIPGGIEAIEREVANQEGNPA